MKKYQIIYADPPWSVSLFSRTERPNQLPHPYPKMKLSEIMSLPIKTLVNPSGCHLFLWVTHKWLPYGFEVMKAWGFNYHCILTWDKTYGFTPYSFMWSTEFCLYGQIPKKWMRPARIGLKSLIQEKPTKHSRKPEAMRKLILEYCGDLPRIELFARQKTPGWDVWGNEVESDIDLTAPE
jgi:N6-adenosine-specific RNA methylase IME4